MAKVKKKNYKECAAYDFFRFESEPCKGCFYFLHDHLHCPYDRFEINFIQLSLFNNY